MSVKDHELTAEANKAASNRTHYLNHLANVQKERAVYTTEDIYNTKGVLVARKGMAINHDMSAKLAKHKLTQPVEHQVEIESSVTLRSLRQMFDQLCHRMDDVHRTHKHCGYRQEFTDTLSGGRLSPALLQKISVFFYRYPDSMDQHLFCAWFTYIVARRFGMPTNKAQRLAIAALCRDIGMLHLDPSLLDSTGTYTPEQWRAMQCHTIVSRYIAEELGEMAPDQLTAIEEHHERFDGMGYPRRLAGYDLSEEGQVLALGDSIASIRFKQFQNSGRTLRDTLPFIQMNSASFNPHAVYSVITLYRESKLDRASMHTYNSIDELVARLKKRAEGIGAAMEALEQVLECLENLDAQHDAHQSLKSAVHVLQMIKRSGQAGDVLMLWLQATAKQAGQEEVADLVECELIQNELYFQLGQVNRRLEAFFNELKSKEDKKLQELFRHSQALWQRCQPLPC